jgi:hypothetical protein
MWDPIRPMRDELHASEWTLGTRLPHVLPVPYLALQARSPRTCSVRAAAPKCGSPQAEAAILAAFSLLRIAPRMS